MSRFGLSWVNQDMEPSPAWALWLGALLIGCTGVVGEGDHDHDVRPTSPARPPSGLPALPQGAPPPAGAAPAQMTPGAAACKATPAGPAGLRRLTPTEFNNTLRDLFAGITVPTQELLEAETVHGFSNIASSQAPSPLLLEQVRQSARALAVAALAKRSVLLPCDPARDGEEACGLRFVNEFGRRAFRRPLTQEESKVFSDFFRAQRAAYNLNVALQLVIEALLQSPHFLYRIEDPAAPAPTAFDMASRLSYLIWGSMPDAELLAAAETGRLATADDLEAHARRLLADPRARRRMVEFHSQWLGFRTFDAVDKDPKAFPMWNPALRSALRSEAEHVVEQAAFDPGDSVDALLTHAKTFATGPVADLYGAPRPAAMMPAWIDLDPARRSGILTSAWLMADLSHAVETSPTFRGVFVLDRLLCAPAPPPPAEVNATPPAMTPGKLRTTRQRLDLHRADPACAACHARIDGVGFGLESFDAIGRFRTTDNGLPIDASGELLGTDVDGSYVGGAALAHKLARSAVVRSCVATQVFRFAMGRIETAEDACRQRELDAAFAAAGYNLRDFLITLVRSVAFRGRDK